VGARRPHLLRRSFAAQRLDLEEEERVIAESGQIIRRRGQVGRLNEEDVWAIRHGQQLIVLGVEGGALLLVGGLPGLVDEALAFRRLPVQSPVDEAGDEVRPVVRVHEIGEPEADRRLACPAGIG